MSEPIDVMGLYACVSVVDLETAEQWYGRLLGRAPDDRPIDGMVQWRNLGGAGIQLWVEPEQAGKARMTIVVPDLDAERARLARAGIVLGADFGGDFGRIAQLADPAGNRVTLAEPPKGFTAG